MNIKQDLHILLQYFYVDVSNHFFGFKIGNKSEVFPISTGKAPYTMV